VRLALSLLLAVLLIALYFTGLVKWLRVAQREHYIASSVTRFYLRWARAALRGFGYSGGRSFVGLVASLLVLVAAAAATSAAVRPWIVCALLSAIVTGRLPLKGRTGKLAWTRRLKLLAAVALAQALLLVLVMTLLVHNALIGLAVAATLVAPSLDLALVVRRRPEDRSARHFTQRASERLARVSPRVVAITGSFGKTSTKQHLTSLLGDSRGVVASPRSFNNRAGLSRAISEGLSDDARIFIAEMGTYGPGEIADLCTWCHPDIAVVTAIGPVHLERMGSLEVIESAKFEITSGVATVILNVDDERLASWPARLTGTRVVRAGTTSDSDVAVREVEGRWEILLAGELLGSTNLVAGVQPTNLACSLAAALELGLGRDEVLEAVTRVHAVANRSAVMTSASGVTIIDDTFNANPSSASSALRTLLTQPITGRRVVVTPGLVELGSSQVRENRNLGAAIAAFGAELIVVGSTNAGPLSQGFGPGAVFVQYREEATRWVRGTLAIHDAVLYLNDLPDHYP